MQQVWTIVSMARKRIWNIWNTQSWDLAVKIEKHNMQIHATINNDYEFITLIFSTGHIRMKFQETPPELCFSWCVQSCFEMCPACTILFHTFFPMCFPGAQGVSLFLPPCCPQSKCSSVVPSPSSPSSASHSLCWFNRLLLKMAQSKQWVLLYR